MAVRFEYKNEKYYVNGEEFYDRLQLTMEQRHLFSKFQHALVAGQKVKSVIYKEKNDDKPKSRNKES